MKAFLHNDQGGSAGLSVWRLVVTTEAGRERPCARKGEPVAHAANRFDVGVTILAEALAQLADMHI